MLDGYSSVAYHPLGPLVPCAPPAAAATEASGVAPPPEEAKELFALVTAMRASPALRRRLFPYAVAPLCSCAVRVAESIGLLTISFCCCCCCCCGCGWATVLVGRADVYGRCRAVACWSWRCTSGLSVSQTWLSDTGVRTYHDMRRYLPTADQSVQRLLSCVHTANTLVD